MYSLIERPTLRGVNSGVWHDYRCSCGDCEGYRVSNGHRAHCTCACCFGDHSMCYSKKCYAGKVEEYSESKYVPTLEDVKESSKIIFGEIKPIGQRERKKSV